MLLERDAQRRCLGVVRHEEVKAEDRDERRRGHKGVDRGMREGCDARDVDEVGAGGGDQVGLGAEGERFGGGEGENRRLSIEVRGLAGGGG